MRTMPSGNMLLSQAVTKALRDAGMNPDVFDADVAIGGVLKFLYDHDAVMTADGVHKRSELLGEASRG